VRDCLEFYRERDLRTAEYMQNQDFEILPVHVGIDATAAEKPPAQLALLALSNQLARVHRRITFDLPSYPIALRVPVRFARPTLDETILSICSKIDPCGDFRIGLPHGGPLVSIGLGNNPSGQYDWYLGADQAVAQDEAESLLHSLANKFGGDVAATDSTRVLRLPGFANRKLPEEFIVQARQESNPVYTLRDFTIDEDSPEAPRHFGEAQERRRTLPNDHESQSEHDWAYAKRALSRGDDPEVVIQRIADFRSNDKSDPVYYARLTVNKAQAQLAAGTSPEKPNEHGGAPENGPEKVPHH